MQMTHLTLAVTCLHWYSVQRFTFLKYIAQVISIIHHSFNYLPLHSICDLKPKNSHVGECLLYANYWLVYVWDSNPWWSRQLLWPIAHCVVYVPEPNRNFATRHHAFFTSDLHWKKKKRKKIKKANVCTQNTL